MSAGLTHHAAITLARAADKLQDLVTQMHQEQPPLGFILLRLELLSADLRRDALEYEHIAAAEYTELEPTTDP